MTRLRAARPEEQALLARWHEDPASPFEDWSGPLPPLVEAGAGGSSAPGSGELVVTDDDDLPLGSVTYRRVAHGPNAGSQAFDIGFTEQGLLRGAQWRGGAFHDLVAFSRLRTDT